MKQPGPDLSSPSPADLYRLQVRELRNYAMFTLDPKGYFTSWNAGVEDLLGFSEREWLGKHACIIFSPEENAVEVCEAEMRKARDAGCVSDVRWHRKKDGTLLFANGIMNALQDEQGLLIGYSKIMSDETARKKLQDSLTESNTALEQFAYAASHDLQEPLRTMSNYAQLLARQYNRKLDDGADQMLDFIVNASLRMTNLVQDLLEYARVTTQEDRPESVSIDDDLETAITNLDEAIKSNEAIVTHDPMPVLRVDRGHMVRLFQNLISNAIKYRKTDVRPEVHISAEQKSSEWVFAIRDNGVGFDPNDAVKIFEPFKRLHSSAEVPGSGVGLAICKRIVGAMGGRIWAESKPGEGSTFYFTLPPRISGE